MPLLFLCFCFQKWFFHIWHNPYSEMNILYYFDVCWSTTRPGSSAGRFILLDSTSNSISFYIWIWNLISFSINLFHRNEFSFLYPTDWYRIIGNSRWRLTSCQIHIWIQAHPIPSAHNTISIFLLGCLLFAKHRKLYEKRERFIPCSLTEDNKIPEVFQEFSRSSPG